MYGRISFQKEAKISCIQKRKMIYLKLNFFEETSPMNSHTVFGFGFKYQIKLQFNVLKKQNKESFYSFTELMAIQKEPRLSLENKHLI